MRLHYALPETPETIGTTRFWPTHLILESTRACNLRCFMCNVHSPNTPRRPTTTLRRDHFLQLEPIFEGLEHVSYGGNGEPFLAADLGWQIDVMRAARPDVWVQSYSNGTLFGDDPIADLALDSVDELILSIDAASPDLYAEIRIGGDFDALRRALENLMSRRSEASRAQISITMLLMRRSFRDVLPMVRLAADLGIPKVYFHGAIWSFDAPTEREQISDQATYDRLWDELFAAEVLGRELGVRVSADHPPLEGLVQPRRPESISTRLRERPAPGWRPAPVTPHSAEVPCDLVWRSVQLMSDGTVQLCCHQATPIGNLYDADFETIWFGDEARRYRAGMLQGRAHGGCSHCFKMDSSARANYVRP